MNYSWIIHYSWRIFNELVNLGKIHVLGEKINGIINSYFSSTSENIEKLPDTTVHEILRSL